MYEAAQQAKSAVGGGLAGNPSRPTQVGIEMERGAKLVSCIDQKIGSLFSRLDGVLAVQPASPETPNKNPIGPTLVGHASALSNHNDQLAQIDSALGMILDRLEL